MANRSVTTAIWSDPRFADLSSAAQLVFLRLVTGPETNAAGATTVLPKAIAVDTNLTRAEAEACIDELVASKLVRRYDDWLWMPGWVEHQVIAGGMLIAARREASRRGQPRALAQAITRALDSRFGTRTTSAGPRTKKVANSRHSRGPSREGPETVPTPSREGSGTYQYQYQDPLPSGGGGPSETTAAPVPGAQPPSQIDGELAVVAGAVALAEVAEEATNAEIGRILDAHAQKMAEAAPLPALEASEPEPAFTGELHQEEVEPSGLRRWEAAELVAWDRTANPAHLAEIERSGSPPARAAAAQLLRGEEHG